MTKILVTGGSGLVGSAIKNISTEFSEYTFFFISSSDVNLLNYEATFEYFNKIKPDIIIHLAANVGGLYKNLENPVSMLEDNLTINSNVLKAAHENGVDRLIGCLSTCVFPDIVEYPINESSLHLGPPHSSNAPYAYSKRILEVSSRAYSKQYSHNYMCIIPTNIYGPNDNFNLNDSHVIPGLIHKCWLAKENKTPFIISGTGKPLRQFIYSYDIARCILLILKSYTLNESIILSPDTSDEISISYIAELIAKEIGYTGEIIYDISKSDGQYKKTASNCLFRTLYPEYKFESIESGIANTVDWFKKNYPNIRK